AGDLAGDRRADDAGSMADDERDLLRRRMHRRDDEIALVFAVVIIGDDKDLTPGEGVDGFADARLGHVVYSPKPLSARNCGLPSRSFKIVNCHNIARAARPRLSQRSNAPMRRSRAKRRSNSVAQPPPSRASGAGP